MKLLKIIIQHIFSIRNERDYKILTILGFKIRLPYYITKNQLTQYLNTFVDITQAPKARGNLRKMQLLELHLMKELKQICDNLGIKFWLRGGTALGAYRHKGFIPWDDDVDLGMMRDDFYNLVNYVNNNSDKYEIVYFYHSNCKVAKFTFKDLKGDIFVDLFPFDYCSYDDFDLFRGQWLEDKAKLMEELGQFHFPHLVYSKYLSAEIVNKIEQINDKYKTKYINNIGGNGICSAIEQIAPFDKKRVFPSDMIFPLKLIDFEDQQFYVMNDLEEYLDIYYGEYMNFPKELDFKGHFYMFSAKKNNEINELYNEHVRGKYD